MEGPSDLVVPNRLSGSSLEITDLIPDPRSPTVADQTGGLDNEERNYMVYADEAWCVGS